MTWQFQCIKSLISVLRALTYWSTRVRDIHPSASQPGLKEKPGEDVGQPGIQAGDTRVSPVSIPGCPTSEPSFAFIICQK